MGNFILLLRKNKNFRRLVTVQLICQFGAWFSYTGIYTLLVELNAPVWIISLTAAMAFIPGILLSPFSGAIVDKLNPYKLLMSILFIESITVFMFLFVNSLAMIFLLEILIFIRMAAGGLYFQAEMGMLPKILDKKEIKLANEIHSMIWSVAYTAGMGLAGFYIYAFGIKSSFIFDGVLYLFGAYILSGFTFKNIISENKDSKVFKMIKDGFTYLKKNKILLHLIVIHGFVGITTYDALITILAKFEYKELLSASLIIGLMNSSRAFAIFLGPVILSKFLNVRTVYYLFIGQGLGILIWAFLQFNFYLGFLGMLSAGFCTSALWAFTFTLIQRNCDREYYGRVIAYNDMFYFTVAASTSFLVGLLYHFGLSIEIITILMASCFFVGANYYRFIFNKYNLQ